MWVFRGRANLTRCVSYSYVVSVFVLICPGVGFKYRCSAFDSVMQVWGAIVLGFVRCIDPISLVGGSLAGVDVVNRISLGSRHLYIYMYDFISYI